MRILLQPNKVRKWGVSANGVHACQWPPRRWREKIVCGVSVCYWLSLKTDWVENAVSFGAALFCKMPRESEENRDRDFSYHSRGLQRRSCVTCNGFRVAQEVRKWPRGRWKRGYRAERPSTRWTEKNLVKMREILIVNRRLSVELVVDELQLGQTTVKNLMTEDLHMWKVYATLVSICRSFGQIQRDNTAASPLQFRPRSYQLFLVPPN